jgi:hypothetical protein
MTEAASMQPAKSCANCLAEKTSLRSACMAIRLAHHSEICAKKSAPSAQNFRWEENN